MLQARVPALCSQAQPSSAPAAASKGPNCTEMEKLRPALPLPRKCTLQASLVKLLSGSKGDAKYIQANIKNSLSYDNGGEKSAERTGLLRLEARTLCLLQES